MEDHQLLPDRDLARVQVPRIGRLVECGDPFEPYRLLDPSGQVVEAVAVFLRDLQAAGRSAATARSYGMDLLRWFRFLWAIDVPWERATRIEAREFSRWIQLTVKPRPPAAGPYPAGGVNAVTGKPVIGAGYAVNTVRHSETVLRSFYELHLEAGIGPIINPFPLHRSRRSARANAHHNPMQPWKRERSGRYRPQAVKRIPRAIPDSMFDELFARLHSNRDRALVSMWVSSGVRAAELLGLTQGLVDPGRQLITVVRKGSRAMQPVPVSTDALVWLRLYQQDLQGKTPVGRSRPLWWTLRRPYTPLTYHAAHRMFERVNDLLGANWTLHDLRHTAARRMADDPAMPLTDVQWVLGHARITTTTVYLSPTVEQVVERTLAHHVRRREAPPPVPAAGYDPASLRTLLGRPA